MFTFSENRSLKIELKNGFTVFIEADGLPNDKMVREDIFDKIKKLFVQGEPYFCREVLVAVTSPSGKIVTLKGAEEEICRPCYYRMAAEKLIALLATLSDRPPEEGRKA